MKNPNKTPSLIKPLIFCFFVAGLFVLSVTPAASAEATKEQALVDKSLMTFKKFMARSDMSYFHEHFKESVGLLIVPTFVKAGFVLGGAGGQGVLLARDKKTGVWSGPAFYTIGSGSLGLQIGGQWSELILLIKSQKVLESLYASSFKMGGDVAVAAGPDGTGASAKGLSADMVSFFRSKGAYAGMSFDGSVIATRDASNTAYYGTPVRPVDIFVLRKVSNPHSAQILEALADVSE